MDLRGVPATVCPAGMIWLTSDSFPGRGVPARALDSTAPAPQSAALRVDESPDGAVNLTKVKKKDREWKGGLIQKVRDLCDEYPTVYVFKYHNMRNERFKELREDLAESSRFMLASTKKLAAALGRTEEDEYKEGIHQLCSHLKGFAGLLFTKLSHDEVKNIFDEFRHEDFARAGAKATETVNLPVGPLLGPHGIPFPHTVEHLLRSHGLPTKLNKGVIELVGPHTVCTEGQTLTSHQATLLRHFDIKMAVFRIKLMSVWRKEKCEYEDLDDGVDFDDGVGDMVEDFGEGDGLPASMFLPDALR